MSEFKDSPTEVRKSVMDSLLAIAVDRSERIVDRIRALSVLHGVGRTCGFLADQETEQLLKDLVDHPALERPSVNGKLGACGDVDPANSHWLQHTALIALMAVNPASGWEKLNHLNENCREPEFVAELRKTRDRFSGGSQRGECGCS